MEANLNEIQKDFLKRIVSNKNIFNIVCFHFIKDDSNIKMTHYTTDHNIWCVIDSAYYKYFYRLDHKYHCFFSKLNGVTCRISDNIKNKDPEYCELGPEILDLEISVNGCPKVGGKNCKFCYKNNTDKEPTNMSFVTFKKIVNKLPKCLYSIAFGITGVKTNPDFPKMLKYCCENDIVPNYTLSGADLDDEIIDITQKYCGAVAVSCYQDNKQLCYDTIKKLHSNGSGLHINMHIVLSEEKDQIQHIWDVLNDIKNNRIDGLRNIVFLRIKPVGRAKITNCQIHLQTYRDIVNFCMQNKIGFGFDSCSAKTVIKVLKELDKNELIQCCEPCESSRFSAYINVKGEYCNCSFCESDCRVKHLDVLECNDFNDIWNNSDVVKIRNIKTEKSCPMFDLDSDC